LDKYGVGQDAYCYAGTSVLRNRLGIHDDEELCRAERDFSELAASEIEFSLPPYDLRRWSVFFTNPWVCRQSSEVRFPRADLHSVPGA
jgi:hypothetical protein